MDVVVERTNAQHAGDQVAEAQGNRPVPSINTLPQRSDIVSDMVTSQIPHFFIFKKPPQSHSKSMGGLASKRANTHLAVSSRSPEDFRKGPCISCFTAIVFACSP